MVDKVRTVLAELGYHEMRESAKEFRMRPLYRDSDNNTVLSVRKDSGRWLDFKLGVGGDLLDLIELHTSDDVGKWMSERNFDVEEFVVTEPTQKIHLARRFDKHNLLKLVKDTSYWEGRGVSKKTLDKFGGGIALGGRLANRYVFPIFNSKEEIVGFSGRDLLDLDYSERPKWKHIGASAHWVYPAQLNVELLRQERSVILVESIGDVLSLYEAGVENVLSLFGINIGVGIINFLIRIDAHDICIALNNDTKSLVGNTAAYKVRDKLTQYFDGSQVKVCLPDKKDFGDMTPEEIKSWNTRRVSQPVASNH